MRKITNRKTGFLFSILFIAMFVNVFADGEQDMSNQKEYYFVQLMGTHEGWPDNMNKQEEKIMGEHYQYLKELVVKKKVLMAGPVMDPVFGLIILQVGSRDEALEIMENEPSVVQGVHTYKMSGMHISLMADHINDDRYAENVTDRILKKEVVVNASLDQVWNAWTTSEGLKKFFTPYSKIDLRVGGPYEIYFSMDVPYGQRGSEDCKILSYIPKKMLSFEWNAPPSIPEYRFRHTFVVLEFEEKEDTSVIVRLSHLGWGKEEGWDKVYNYFDAAWSGVLGSLKKNLEEN